MNIELTARQQRALLEFSGDSTVEIGAHDGVYRGAVAVHSARGEDAVIDERGVIRASTPTAIPARAVIGDLIIDRHTREVFLGGAEVYLSATEFDFLALLASAPHRVWTKSELYRLVWGGDWERRTTRTIDAHACRLRSHLGGGRWIISLRGVGYRLCNDQVALVAA